MIFETCCDPSRVFSGSSQSLLTYCFAPLFLLWYATHCCCFAPALLSLITNFIFSSSTNVNGLKKGDLFLPMPPQLAWDRHVTCREHWLYLNGPIPLTSKLSLIWTQLFNRWRCFKHNTWKNCQASQVSGWNRTDVSPEIPEQNMFCSTYYILPGQCTLDA